VRDKNRPLVHENSLPHPILRGHALPLFTHEGEGEDVGGGEEGENERRDVLREVVQAPVNDW
jgi:hypothetical protein